MASAHEASIALAVPEHVAATPSAVPVHDACTSSAVPVHRSTFSFAEPVHEAGISVQLRPISSAVQGCWSVCIRLPDEFVCVQSEIETDAAGENCPLGQLVQDVRSLRPYFPAGQSLHAVLSSVTSKSLYLPAGHEVLRRHTRLNE